MWRRMRRKRRRREEEDEKENNGEVGLTNIFFFKSLNKNCNDFHVVLCLLWGSPSLPQSHWKSGSLFLYWYIQSLELPFSPRLFSKAQQQ